MNLVSFIEHTLLKADCTKEDVLRICEEARQFNFCAVCVPPYLVKYAKQALKDSLIKVVTVIGFPMGYSAIAAKVEEIKRALNDGADELDVVVNIIAVKNKEWSHVKSDIDSTTRAVHLKGKTVKVIFETGLLSNEEIKKLCEICTEIEVDYVKTSTGYNGSGASPETISLLKQNLSKKIKIKASGGIRTKEAAIKLIEAGANRLGCSASIAIVEESAD